MTTTQLASSTLRIGSSLQRRYITSLSRNVGALKQQPKKLAPPATTRSFSSSSATPKTTPPTPRATPKTRFPPIPETETIEITPTIQRNNVLLATALMLFCGGVMYYSITAVGQAGNVDGSSDPLAALKQEAEEAQLKKDRSNQELADTQEMLQKVNSGDFDPDQYDELDDDAQLAKKKKKAWWKFW